MIYNILNGDSLAQSFPETNIEGEIVVCREALIDGGLAGDSLDEFWKTRATYMGLTDHEYHNNVVKEFEKISNAPGNAEFNLWFEYDLFCQVNMWFLISIINSLSIQKKVYVVQTTYLDKSSKQFWNGFGPANATELRRCFSDKVLLSNQDLQLGQNLWTAYKSSDLTTLMRLAEYQSAAFPYLQEVIIAHVDRFPKEGGNGRPERVIEEIIKNTSGDFDQVFKEFWNSESIYGFGDTQLKQIYNRVIHYR